MAPDRRSRLRSLLLNGGLSAGSVLVVFGAVELFLRITALAPSEALRSPDLETLERIPGVYAPGQEFTDRVRRDLPSRIRINNLGFRGRDLEEAKGPGVFRVMALGDSYTFGDHVDTGQSYPARLEGILRDRLGRPSGPRAPEAGEEARSVGSLETALDEGRGISAIEVINGGANGFGILDMEALWAKAGRRLDPDVVLITFSPNDISDMTRPAPMIEQMRRNAALKSRPVVGRAIRVAQRTALFNGMQILAARWKVRTREHDAIPALEPARAGPDSAPEVWNAYREALLRLATALRGDSRRALLVLYPSHRHVSGEEPFHAGEVLPAWAAEAGLPCLDLLPVFREGAREAEVLYLLPRDSHPSPAGHEVAAEAVAREIEALGWLAGS